MPQSCVIRMVKESDVMQSLGLVEDPEMKMSVTELGLIYAIRIEQQDEGTHAEIDMTLTSPACPAGPQIVQQAKMALERLHLVEEAEIKLVMTPPWTPERMTDEARDHLGIF